jgi:predicted nucleic acid-binding protein
VDLDATETPAIVFGATQALCRKHGLTAYDAAYLEVAIRGAYALATVDDDLRRAAIAEGVPLLQLDSARKAHPAIAEALA